MNYPIVIHKDRRSDYGVTVPDLPGCFSVGRTMDEAIAMAREAIELHIEGLIEAGRPVPAARRIEEQAKKATYKGGVWALVSIDPATLRTNAKRINITIPERVLDQVDRFARQTGDTRSGLLVRAATSYIGKSDKRNRPSAKRTPSRRRRGKTRA